MPREAFEKPAIVNTTLALDSGDVPSVGLSGATVLATVTDKNYAVPPVMTWFLTSVSRLSRGTVTSAVQSMNLQGFVCTVV